MKIVILSGRSGSGKTIALQALEDHEFFCIDNLPLSMMPELIQKLEPAQDAIAVSIDARSVPDDLNEFNDIYQQMRASSHNIEVIYLDADDATLLKRFSETRRRHPLTQDDMSLREAITHERELLDQIRHAADLNVDTSSLNVHQLRDLIKYRVKGDDTGLDLMFISFGYKHGIPSDADYVFDARCLPNPYWEESLRKFTGKDEVVQEFLSEKPLVQEFFWQVKVFLHTWLPRFETDNRSYLTIGIGCTGGQHRSVYLSEKLAEHFRKEHTKVTVRHRELDAKGY